MNRREFLLANSLLALGGLVGCKSTPHEVTDVAAAFDGELNRFMAERKVPGGALAVVRKGRLVYARGYGLADRDQNVSVKPDSLFRIGSISKCFTSAAVHSLVERGKVHLDDRAFDLLKLNPMLVPGQQRDPRVGLVTVRHLLQHTGGWDSNKSFDPMFSPKLIAEKVGVASPPGPEAIIRYMMDHPLQFDPGTRHVYSNFGYCVLGQIIAAVSGQSYESFVQEHILAPAGIRRMRIGRSLEKQRAPGEVRYYTADGAPDTGDSVFPGTPERVPLPYGAFHLEATAASGGWLASAVDLARFAAALDNPERSPLLKATTIRQMYEPPPAPVFRKDDGTLEDVYYASGWIIRQLVGGNKNYWHFGGMPGTWTLLARRWDGLSWAVLFNQISEVSNSAQHPDLAIDPALHRAADAVKFWPGHNLFGRW